MVYIALQSHVLADVMWCHWTITVCMTEDREGQVLIEKCYYDTLIIAIHRSLNLTYLKVTTHKTNIKLPFMSACVGVHAKCVWLDTRLHVVITQDPTPTSLSTFWIGNVESSSNHLQATTPQLAMGKLLCGLSIEDSSLERLPASILITSLTEIWKSLFSTLPSSFSRCPMVLTSCCSLISAQINPQHTWWDFQYSSQFQKEKIELSLCKSSSCYHQCRFDPYQSQSVYMDMRSFGYCWVRVTIPRSKQCFRHCVCP